MNKISYTITRDHNGVSEIYIPKENGLTFEPKSGRNDRWMVSFKTRNAAVKFLLKQGATEAEIQDK